MCWSWKIHSSHIKNSCHPKVSRVLNLNIDGLSVIKSIKHWYPNIVPLIFSVNVKCKALRVFTSSVARFEKWTLYHVILHQFKVLLHHFNGSSSARGLWIFLQILICNLCSFCLHSYVVSGCYQQAIGHKLWQTSKYNFFIGPTTRWKSDTWWTTAQLATHSTTLHVNTL